MGDPAVRNGTQGYQILHGSIACNPGELNNQFVSEEEKVIGS